MLAYWYFIEPYMDVYVYSHLTANIHKCTNCHNNAIQLWFTNALKKTERLTSVKMLILEFA